MPTPKKHLLSGDCPALELSRHTNIVTYCPDDDAYFYRGCRIFICYRDYHTTIGLNVYHRKSFDGIMKCIDQVLEVCEDE